MSWVFATDVVKFFTQLLVTVRETGVAPPMRRDRSPPTRGTAFERLLQFSWVATIALLVFVVHRRYSDERLMQTESDGVMDVVESTVAQIEDILRYGPGGKGRPGPHQSFARDAAQLRVQLG